MGHIHITSRVLLASTIIALTLAVSLSRAALSAPAVDAGFAHFYYTQGGARLLGPAIAPRQGSTQYFELGRLEDERGQGRPRDWEIVLGRVAAELIERGLPIPVTGDTGPGRPARAGGHSPAPAPIYPNWKGEYFANADLLGEASLIRDDPRIAFNWGSGAPSAGLPDDFFSVRWTREIQVPSDTTYRVSVRADDGARVWIDGRLIVDHWRDLTRAEGAIFLPSGTYPARVEYREGSGEASIGLTLAPIDTIRAWRGVYHNNDALAGRPYFERDDATIDFAWGAGGPGSGVKRDGFSARWTRALELDRGRHEFTVIADDGVRLSIDGRLVLDRWESIGPPTTYTVTVPLAGGEHAVRLDYRDRTGEARVALRHARAR
jgi:RNase P/RNase MRP subunit p29